MPKHYNTPKTLLEKFWDKVSIYGPMLMPELGCCWMWIGCRTKGRYGQMTVIRTVCYAHHVSWILHRGDIPLGQWVLHRCDNMACVRPSHLFLGTRRDNVRDMFSKGRDKVVGVRNWNAKLTEEQVRQIRKEPYYRGAFIQLGKKYGVSETTIRDVRTREVWRHVT